MSGGTREDLPNPPAPVERQVQGDDPNKSLPGQRAALQRGALRDRLPEPQGDENREPPAEPTPPP